MGSGVGGSSALYGMVLERFREMDFKEWPVSYAAMEKYYTEAEQLFKVAKSSDFSHPAHATLSTHFNELGLKTYTLPLSGKNILKKFGLLFIASAEKNVMLAHVCGTVRMGNDSETSVVDSHNKVHGTENVYVVDSSFFPSSGSTNPTLIIAANALRVAELIILEIERRIKMKVLYTEMQIDAEPEKIWQVLTDFEKYKKWCQFIPYIDGPLQLHKKLRMEMVAPSQKKQGVTVEITKVVPNQELRWVGNFKSIPGLIRGEHIFEIRKLDNKKCLFVHREQFSGIMVPVVWGFYLNRHLKNGFIQFNNDLKKYLEDKSF